jgi:hypothetical protein
MSRYTIGPSRPLLRVRGGCRYRLKHGAEVSIRDGGLKPPQERRGLGPEVVNRIRHGFAQSERAVGQLMRDSRCEAFLSRRASSPMITGSSRSVVCAPWVVVVAASGSAGPFGHTVHMPTTSPSTTTQRACATANPRTHTETPGRAMALAIALRTGPHERCIAIKRPTRARRATFPRLSSSSFKSCATTVHRARRSTDTRASMTGHSWAASRARSGGVVEMAPRHHPSPLMRARPSRASGQSAAAAIATSPRRVGGVTTHPSSSSLLACHASQDRLGERRDRAPWSSPFSPSR